jgi:hypothetical protein
MSAHFTTPTDELLLLAETLGEVKTKADKLEAEFATQARPLEAATNALSAALSGIKALQFHVLDNNLGALSARVEEMRKAVDEQVGVIALELKKADETNAAKAGQEAEALRSEIAALQAQLGTLGAQFAAQLERVEFSAKEEAKKLQLIPGPAGAAGASLNPRGTFIDGETYNRLDVVSWLGSSYIAAVDGVTEKPSKNSNQWQVLASRGSGGSGGAGDFGSLAGVAQINQGGTGQTTRAAGLNALLPSQTGNVQYMLLTDGAGTVSWGAQPVAGLPSQTSNGGKLLTTDGTNASWSNAVTVSGSNATVTGTLTANGLLTAAATTSLDGLPTAAIFGATKRIAIGYNTSGDYGFVASADSGTTWKELHLNPVGGIVKVPNTSASTTTSTGALVVGNGTSGGLGVGGNINAGGYLRSINSSAANGSEFTALRADVGADGTLGAALVTIGVLPSATAASRYGFITCYDNGDWRTLYLGGSPGVAANGGQVRVPATITSTSTSTGALVVGNGTSGGLGVGGSIYAGGDVFVVKADPSSTLTRTANTNNALFQLTTGATYDFAFGLRNTTDSDFHLYNYGTSADAIKIARSTSVVSVLSSTASTSTSSGALVVSGGVGVAGAIFSGGYIHAGGDSDFYLRGAGSGNGLLRGNYVSADVDGAFRIRNAAGSTTYVEVASTGLIAAIPATAPSLTVNGTMTFERTSNTSLKISVRGTDGTTRSVSLTLA